MGLPHNERKMWVDMIRQQKEAEAEELKKTAPK